MQLPIGPEQDVGMDRLRELLVDLKRNQYAQENFLGLLNVLIGCTIEAPNGEVVSTGVTWRALAEQLKKVRWTKQAASELGIELGTFAPRDRQRFWYQVIAHAGVDSPRARSAGTQMLEKLRQMGYRIKGAAETANPLAKPEPPTG
jgi:hypothetical protein